MTPVEFGEQNMTFAKDQPQYIPLPAHHFRDREGRVIFCWQLTDDEKAEILRTGLIWHEVVTFNNPLQPQLLHAVKPAMGACDA